MIENKSKIAPTQSASHCRPPFVFHTASHGAGPARRRADLLQPALRGERPVAALGKAAGRRRRLAVLAQPEAVSAARVQVQRRRRRGVRRRRRRECELPRVLERPGRPRDGVVLVVDEQRRRRLRIDGQLGRELGRRLVVVLQQLPRVHEHRKIRVARLVVGRVDARVEPLAPRRRDVRRQMASGRRAHEADLLRVDAVLAGAVSDHADRSLRVLQRRPRPRQARVGRALAEAVAAVPAGNAILEHRRLRRPSNLGDAHKTRPPCPRRGCGTRRPAL